MAKPVKCARCGRENDPSFASCLDCGQALKAAPPAPAKELACAGCGAKVQPGFKFCGHCGRPIAPAPAPAAAAPAPPAAAPSAPAPLPTTPHPRAADPLALAAQTSTAFQDPPLHPHGSEPRGAGLRLTAVRHDGLPSATFPLDRPEVLCGRTAGEVRLAEDPAVSPRHARFTVSGGAVRVEDLGSVNGTFVRVRAPRPLTIGEELRVGRQLLRLEPLPRPPSDDPHAVRPWGARDDGCRFRLAQLLEGGGLGEIFPLQPGANHLGRDAGEIVFPADRYVSARHARLDVAGEEITLVDLESSNGTFVKVVGPIDLAPGDELVVGAQLLRLEA